MDNLTKKLAAYNDSNTPTMEKIKGLIEIFESHWSLKQPWPTSERIIREFVNFATKDTLVTVISRGLLNVIIDKIQMYKTPDRCLPLLNLILEKIQSRLLSFEEQLFQIRIIICEHYEKDGKFLEAAKILSLSNLETSQKTYSNEYKLKLYLRVAQLYVKADDFKLAESFVNRASIIQLDSVNPMLLIELKIIQAQSFEHKGKFGDAAQRFTSLCVANEHISEALSFDFLKQALACTLLSPCDDHRSLLLTHFMNDARCAQFNVSSIVRSMYNDGFISNQEIEILHEFLSEKQRIQKINDMTVLHYVTTEHNIIVYSKVYKNLYLSFLSKSLGISIDLLQQIISTMIYEKRLDAVMDQVKMAIVFDTIHPGKHLDAQVNSITTDIDSLYRDINKINGKGLMSLAPKFKKNNTNKNLLSYNVDRVKDSDENQQSISLVELKIMEMMPLFETDNNDLKDISKQDENRLQQHTSNTSKVSFKGKPMASEKSEKNVSPDFKYLDSMGDNVVKSMSDSKSTDNKLAAKVRATRVKSANGFEDGKTTMKIRIDRDCASESRERNSRLQKLPRSQKKEDVQAHYKSRVNSKITDIEMV